MYNTNIPVRRRRSILEALEANFIDTRSRQEPTLEETSLILQRWISADSKYLSHTWASTMPWTVWTVLRTSRRLYVFILGAAMCYDRSCEQLGEHNLNKIEDGDTVGFANMHVLSASSTL